MEAPDFISSRVLSGSYFFLDLDPDGSKPVQVVCGGRETCGSTYDLRRETFPFWSMEYVIAGSGRLTIHGNSFPIGPGTLFRYGPEIPHAIEVDSGSTLDKAFIDFVGVETSTWWTGPWESLAPLHVPTYSAIRDLFAAAFQYGLRGGSNAPRLCALLTEQIALLAVEEAVDAALSESHAWTTYVRCRAEIERNFLSLRTLKEMAQHCHVGEAWLCRLFSRFDTESPYQYLVGRKMAFAASRLADSTLLVKEVAAEAGYDPYHFSKAFKTVMGLSPEAFRRTMGPRYAPPSAAARPSQPL